MVVLWGGNIGIPSQEILNIRIKPGLVTRLTNLYLTGLLFHFEGIHSNIFFSPPANTEGVIFDGKVRVSTFFIGWNLYREKHLALSDNRGSYDTSQGGMTDTQNILYEESKISNDLTKLFVKVRRQLKVKAHSFIPTKSALAYIGSTVLDEVIGNKDRTCTGETPFDSYFAPQNNEQHVFLTSENVEWLTQEIEGNVQNPSIYIPSTTTITGNNLVCYDQIAIFSTSLGASCIENIIWSTSSNIEIIDNTGASITVQTTYANSAGEGWIKATFANNTSITKNVEVGKPQTSKMVFNRYASYDFLNVRWNLLGVYYNGQLMIDKYLWEWQVAYSLIRQTSPYHSYINFRPNVSSTTSIYIRTRASNDCGCSDWFGSWFDVIKTNISPCGGANQPPCKSDIIEY